MKIPVLNKSTWFGLLAVAIVGGASGAVLINGSNQPITQLNNPAQSSIAPSVSPATNQISQTTAAKPAVDGQLAVYWIESKKNKLIAIPIAIKAKSNDEAIASVLNILIAENPPESTLYSAIPANTKVLSAITKDQEIRLDLSKDFTKGGGSASMQGRIIQVLYTATSLEPEAKVYLSVEGKALKYIGGEGLPVPQPMTRKDFALEF
ncbi:MAG: GerMN domain-containing protein [Pseudanabaena sp.]|jgi:spore germination protein GerM